MLIVHAGIVGREGLLFILEAIEQGIGLILTGLVNHLPLFVSTCSVAV